MIVPDVQSLQVVQVADLVRQFFDVVVPHIEFDDVLQVGNGSDVIELVPA